MFSRCLFLLVVCSVLRLLLRVSVCAELPELIINEMNEYIGFVASEAMMYSRVYFKLLLAVQLRPTRLPNTSIVDKLLPESAHE